MSIYKEHRKKGISYTIKVTKTIAPGQQKSFYATAHTLAEAKVKEQELRGKLAITASSLSVAEGANRYLSDHKLRCKITTYQSTHLIITKQIIPRLGKYKITDVTPRVIRNLQNDWLESNYQPSYLSLLNSKLSSLFNYFLRFYGLPSNPVKLAGPLGARHAKEMAFWTLDEYEKFYAGLDGSNDESYKVLFQLLFYTGCRIGEAFALFPADVNVEERYICISKTFVHLNGQDILQTPKTRSSIRQVSIPSFLAKQIEDYMTRLPEKKMRLFFNISKFALHRKMRSVCQKTGVKLIRVHDLRHSAVAFLISQNVPIIEISKRCGHRSPDITYHVYAHMYPSKEKSIADLLDTIHENRNITT